VSEHTQRHPQTKRVHIECTHSPAYYHLVSPWLPRQRFQRPRQGSGGERRCAFDAKKLQIGAKSSRQNAKNFVPKLGQTMADAAKQVKIKVGVVKRYACRSLHACRGTFFYALRFHPPYFIFLMAFPSVRSATSRLVLASACPPLPGASVIESVCCGRAATKVTARPLDLIRVRDVVYWGCCNIPNTQYP